MSSAWAINKHNLQYEQSILPVDDIMAEDLLVSCCTEANNSVADECQMNPDVNKWASIEDATHATLKV